MSPWLDKPRPCAHADRPVAGETLSIHFGRIWECSDCKGRWRIILADPDPERELKPDDPPPWVARWERI